jgi:hypothetical protein
MQPILARLDQTLPGWSIRRRLRNRISNSALNHFRQRFRLAKYRDQGLQYAAGWPEPKAPVPERSLPANRFQEFVSRRTSGRGVWKWSHYLDIYDRHCAKFVGRSPHVLEIGIYSGGSLDMWADYFGPGSRLIGVDLEPAVRAYERDGVQIFVGDQGDRRFWSSIAPSLPALDVVIDDGGHRPHQQIATLEALLPLMAPGGVYICEDIHRETHGFAAYISGLTAALHAHRLVPHPDTPSYVVTSPFQATVKAIHTYPFIVVIEMQEAAVSSLIAPRVGTEWQPFYEPSHRRPAQ